MFYGNSPYFWLWDESNTIQSIFSSTPVFGEFCYNPSVNGKFVTFYTIQTYSTHQLSFSWGGRCFLIYPKWREFEPENGSIPVLGARVACPVYIYKKLETLVLQHNKFNKKQLRFSIRRCNLSLNKLIIRTWDPNCNMNRETVTIKCFFHEDKTASAVFNTTNGSHFCYACKKKRYALLKHLKALKPEIYKMLISKNPTILK